jgi:hypothetical protein
LRQLILFLQRHPHLLATDKPQRHRAFAERFSLRGFTGHENRLLDWGQALRNRFFPIFHGITSIIPGCFRLRQPNGFCLSVKPSFFANSFRSGIEVEKYALSGTRKVRSFFLGEWKANKKYLKAFV